LLAGGAEFGRRMARADQRAIHLAGGMGVPIRIIPAAAAADNNHVHAGNNGVRWFSQLGAKDVASLPLIDRDSADLPELEAELRRARLVYMLGGDPDYLYNSLAGSRAWQAVLEAYQEGAVIAGSSAGAMVMCEHFFNPHTREIKRGLDLVLNSAVLPHFSQFKSGWLETLHEGLPLSNLVGIEEETAIIDDGIEEDSDDDLDNPQRAWMVYGGKQVTLIQPSATQVFRPGELFSF
ncbi:MAG: Type 1 glutamine amidotransferase-like domain-containing protein, partial [Anaerolineales bacterium]